MSYTYETERESAEGFVNYTIEFSVTSWGSPPSWEDPGDPEEIEIESIAVRQHSAPDDVIVYSSTPPGTSWKEFPDDLYESLELEVLEKFDFADALWGLQEDYADYEYERRRDGG